MLNDEQWDQLQPNKNEIHPAPIEITNNQLALDPILQFFHYAHLPPKLQTTSHQFFMLASFIINNLPRNAERTVALRKLLEAKDAAVRANLPPPGFGQTKPPVAFPTIGEQMQIGDNEGSPMKFED